MIVSLHYVSKQFSANVHTLRVVMKQVSHPPYVGASLFENHCYIISGSAFSLGRAKML